MKYFCSTCNVSLSCEKSLKRHCLSVKHIKRLDENVTHSCICGRSFTLLTNLSRHRKKCIQYKERNSNPTHVETLLKENCKMRERLDNQDKEIERKNQEMDELRKKVEMLLERTSANQTNNTTNNIQTLNSIGNQTHNVIVVNSFGNENIDHLTDKIICKLIQTAPFTCIPQLVEKIHFDPEHPENHNIKITNKKMNYAEIVKDNKWVTANKKKVIDDVIQKSYNILDETYTDNKDSLSEKRQERFENFQDKYEGDNEELLRNIKNDVDLILINGTNELHK